MDDKTTTYPADFALWPDGYFVHKDDLNIEQEITNGRSDDFEMVTEIHLEMLDLYVE